MILNYFDFLILVGNTSADQRDPTPAHGGHYNKLEIHLWTDQSDLSFSFPGGLPHCLSFVVICISIGCFISHKHSITFRISALLLMANMGGVEADRPCFGSTSEILDNRTMCS
jgi:hypothetical protein